MKKYFAELIGTSFLVLFGCGSAIIAGTSLNVLGIAIAFGLTLTILVYFLTNLR